MGQSVGTRNTDIKNNTAPSLGAVLFVGARLLACDFNAFAILKKTFKIEEGGV